MPLFPVWRQDLVQIEGHESSFWSSHETVSLEGWGTQSSSTAKKASRPLASLEDAIKLRAHANQIKAELIAPIAERGIVELGTIDQAAFEQATVDHVAFDQATVDQGIAEFDNSWQWRCDQLPKCDSLYRMSQAHAGSDCGGYWMPLN